MCAQIPAPPSIAFNSRASVFVSSRLSSRSAFPPGLRLLAMPVSLRYWFRLRSFARSHPSRNACIPDSSRPISKTVFGFLLTLSFAFSDNVLTDEDIGRWGFKVNGTRIRYKFYFGARKNFLG